MHFLDLSHIELRKPTQSISIIKLQSLLDLAMNADSTASHTDSSDVGDMVFRKNIKVTMAGSGLYEWLLKIANMGGLGGGEAREPADGTLRNVKEKEKEKDDKKPMLGENLSCHMLNCLLIFSLRV
jgi:gamma-tubulin complex component 2